MTEESIEQKQTMGNITLLERRDWELWCMAILMILVLTLYILISHIWEIGDSPREWFREIVSIKTYLAGSTFLILLFCLYVTLKNFELRRLRKQLILQKVELKQIASTLEEFTAFYQISSVIIAKHSLTTILETIVQESLKCLKADRSSFYQLDSEKGFLIRKVSFSSNPFYEKVNLSEEKEVARKVVLQDQPFLLGKPEDFVNFFNYAEREEKINALMSLPVLADGKPIGALSVARINKEYGFSEEDTKKLSIFSNYASLAIENFDLLKELQKKISRQKDFEKYSNNILELWQDLSEEERKKIEEYGRNLWHKRKAKTGEKITLMSELGIERRTSERIEEVLQVEFENEFLAQTFNISEGGAFIHTSNPLELEEEFHLKLYIPDDQEPINIVCKVIWTNKYGKGNKKLPQGMGIKFLRLNPEHRKKIEEFIELQKSKKLLQENEQPS